MSRTTRCCSKDSLPCQSALNSRDIAGQALCEGGYHVISSVTLGTPMSSGPCRQLRRNEAEGRTCLKRCINLGTLNAPRNTTLTESTSLPPAIQTSHIGIHIVEPRGPNINN